MSMSTYIIGFKSKDTELYKKHAAVLRACIDAEIKQLPKETAEFFESDSVEEYLFEDKLEVELENISSEYNGDCQNGFEIEVSKIPKNVNVIRFYNSW